MKFWEALKEMEAECLVDKKLEPGRGQWRRAAYPIKTKSGKWRMVCDYSVTKNIVQRSNPIRCPS